MNVQEALQNSINTLANHGLVATARLDSLLLLELVLTQPKEWLLANQEFKLKKSQTAKLADLINKRSGHYPIAYLTGKREFYGLDFNVTEDVLIPRPESEAIVEWVISNAPNNAEVLDVGCGSGCLSISIKKMRNDLEVNALDISKKALKIAEKNAKNHNCVIDFMQSDLLSNLEGSSQKFDIIVANLPYVPLENEHSNQEIKFEPAQALYAKNDGLEIVSKFIAQYPTFLAPGGKVLLEHDPSQLQKIQALTSNLTSVTPFVSVIN